MIRTKKQEETKNILFNLSDEISDWHKGTISKNSSFKFKQKRNKHLILSKNRIFLT